MFQTGRKLEGITSDIIQTLIPNFMLMQEKILRKMKREDCLNQCVSAIKRDLEKNKEISIELIMPVIAKAFDDNFDSLKS